jgi:hypothetical protein
MTTHEAEQQIVEGGYTLGAFNRYYHASIAANIGTSIMAHETGHLRYEQGRGIVKTQEATCLLCEQWGLNDGRWHEVPAEGEGR